MAKATQESRQSFLERIGNLTRSATSLRARIRKGINRAPETVNVEPRPAEPEKVTREAVAPEGQCLYAIGDIHGRRDLLEQLIGKIEEDVSALPETATSRTLVFLGDYIDRGLQSRDVIEFLLSDRLKSFERVFLMGNHEEALLRFLNDVNFGKQWVRYGGAETLYSYGLAPPNTRASLRSHEAMEAANQAWDKVWTSFRQNLPQAHLDFYQSLQHYYVAGDYLFVHAGLRPDVALENQTVRDMLWIRDEFLEAPQSFDQVVVHGHTPGEAIYRDNRRIGLDTGAFISGKLSAARLFGKDVSFLTT
ncbi:MAG: metallophosphoesterase family protein [Hyphomonas sp.]|uniref:metallophosphoesterase family protein n=1 Tax=Hyphomonas sp. TaxID=87 RepID=UPI003527D236